MPRNSEKKKPKKVSGKPIENDAKPRVLDLFSGAGGLSCGLEQSGFEIAGGIDFFPKAIESFEANHHNARGLVADLTKTSIKTIENIAGGDIDLIVGGPSCQGFSTAGGLSKQIGRDESDPRNNLFSDYVRIVDHFQPSWLIFENVPGLLLYRQGTVALSIVSALNAIGYKIVPMILLAADYGVPQLRRRLVFVGTRTGSDIHFPAPTHGDENLWANYSLPFAHLSRLSTDDQIRHPHVTFEQACSDLPKLSEGETLHMVPYAGRATTDYQRQLRQGLKLVRQHQADRLADLDRYAAKHLLPGENWRALVKHDILPPRFKKIRPYDATTMLKRLQGDKPAYTITTKFNEATTGAFIHPSQPRTLSIREAARIQSFPDRFSFSGTFGHIRTQIGNAVPPLLAKALGEAILPQIMRSEFNKEIPAIRPTITISNSISEDEILQLKGAGKQMHQRKKKDPKQLELIKSAN
ncbi:DNA cytosine methyltransferase [Haloferula sp.]|uniref:DNA cytosine methyltransferase n=1 Tax=Haloferula sp. TaxID=2497595 RepID=UPI003C73F9BE